MDVNIAKLRPLLERNCGGNLHNLQSMSLCPSLSWLYGEVSKAQHRLDNTVAETDEDVPACSDAMASGSEEAKGQEVRAS